MTPEAIVKQRKTVHNGGTVFVINRRANRHRMPVSVRVTQQEFRAFHLPQETLGSNKPWPNNFTAEEISKSASIIRPTAASKGVPDDTKQRLLFLSGWGIRFN